MEHWSKLKIPVGTLLFCKTTDFISTTPVFPLMSFFSSRLPLRVTSLSSLPVSDSFLGFPCLSWPWQLWDVLIRCSVEFPSVWIFRCFLVIRPGLWTWGKNTTEVSVLLTASHQRHITAPDRPPVMATLITWSKWHLSGLPTVNLSFSIIYLFRSQSLNPLAELLTSHFITRLCSLDRLLTSA